MAFHAIKQKVLNRGVPPDRFLDELIAWGRTAPDEIFAPNQHPDIYSNVLEVLGPWQGLRHRRAVMLEVMRVLAGFESSWDWNAGVDTTNPSSTTPETIEAGAWQVSANSMGFGQELEDLVLRKVGSLDGDDFQRAMKRDHQLAMEYVARLLRRTVRHHGPVKRHEIDPWLRRDAVAEFQALLDGPLPESRAGSMSRALESERSGDEAVLRELAADHDLSDAMEALIRVRNERGAPMSARYWAISNFDLRSNKPRLFLFDVRDRGVQSYLCAHGIGSEGPTDDGYASIFSNESGSNCTSLGVYRCAETYSGRHGFSMRLDGLEPTNSNARARAIVVHGADYVSPEIIRRTGRIGRSDGCLAVENRYATEVATALTGGSLVLAWSSTASRAGLARFVANVDGGEVWSELEPPEAFVGARATETAAALAEQIKRSAKIILARNHASGVNDNATAFQNIEDTAAGRAAHRSSYGNAPGGVVNLDPNMLKGMLALAEDFRFSVSEFCGGSHDANSRHYAGCTADINTIDGRHVGAGEKAAAFQRRCRELGATEVLGPGDRGHSTHVHAGWPRP